MPEKNIDALKRNSCLKLLEEQKYKIKTPLDNFKGSLSNVCYMNATLQLLFNVPELTIYALSNRYIKDKKVNNGMADCYKDLILNAKDPVERLKSLEKLKKVSGQLNNYFLDNGQKNAYEWLSLLLNTMYKELSTYEKYNNEEEFELLEQNFGHDSKVMAKVISKYEKMKKVLKKRNSLLDMLFYSTLVESKYCSECNSFFSCCLRKRDMTELDINFETLHDALNSFSHEYCGLNLFCEKCNRDVEVYENSRLITLPNYFIVTEEFDQGKKPCVRFPLNTTFGNLVMNKEDQNAEYKLISIVCHSGDVNSGHYTNYSKEGDIWCYYSDGYVEKKPDSFDPSKDESIRKNAYFLLYERIDKKYKDIIDFFAGDQEDLKIISELSKKEEVKEQEQVQNEIKVYNNNNPALKPEQSSELPKIDNKNPGDESSNKEEVKEQEQVQNEIKVYNNNNPALKPEQSSELPKIDNKNPGDKFCKKREVKKQEQEQNEIKDNNNNDPALKPEQSSELPKIDNKNPGDKFCKKREVKKQEQEQNEIKVYNNNDPVLKPEQNSELPKIDNKNPEDESSNKEEVKEQEQVKNEIKVYNNNNPALKTEQSSELPKIDNKNPGDEKIKNELSCDLENLLKMSKTLDELKNNFVKVKDKDKKNVFDESRKQLDKVFDNNKSDRKIFKELLNTNGGINQALDKIKKELIVCIMCSNMTQNEKSVYIEYVKKIDKIIWLRRIWQIIKNILLFRFSEVNKSGQSIVFERINELRIRISTKKQR